MAKVCPHCGSSVFTKSGTQKNSRTHTEHQRYRCKKCWKHFTHPRWTGSKEGKTAKNGDLPPVNGEEDSSYR